jgi:RHS repeat-associated protein
VDEVFMRTDSSGSFTPLKDALGSTIALVDSNGHVQTSYTYDPFGGTSVTGTSSPNEFQYTGRENEGNGLYFYRNRYYSPVLGRFINEDPAGYGLNFYAYADDDPIDFSDPFGLLPGGSAAPATPPSTSPNGGLRLIHGGKAFKAAEEAARFLPQDGVEWVMAGALFVADAALAYEDFDTFQAIMASNQAQDEEIWAQNRSSQDRMNQQLVQQKILAGRYTQKDIDYKEYKKRCGQPAPAGLGICGKMIWSQQRNLDCRDMRQIWDDKYSPGEHAKDIRDLTRGILRDQKNIDRYCK